MFLFLLSSHHAFGTAMGLALMHTFLVLAILIDNLLVTWPDLAICELIDLDQTIYPQWDQKNIRHQCTSPPCRRQCEFEKRIPERSSANVRILEDITYINFWWAINNPKYYRDFEVIKFQSNVGFIPYKRGSFIAHRGFESLFRWSVHFSSQGLLESYEDQMGMYGAPTPLLHIFWGRIDWHQPNCHM